MAKGGKIRHSSFFENGSPEQVTQQMVAWMDNLNQKLEAEVQKLIAELEKMGGKITGAISAANIKAVNDQSKAIDNAKNKITEYSRVIQNNNKLKEQYYQTTAKLTAIEGNGSRAVEKQKQALKESTIAMQKDVAIRREAEGSYKRITLELQRNIDQYKKLGVAQREGSKGGTLLTSIKSQQQQLALLNTQLGKTTGGFQAFGSQLLDGAGIYAGVAGITAGLVQLGKALFNRTKELDALKFTLQTVITNSTELSTTWAFLTDISSRYGQELIGLTESYVRFKAAMKSTNTTAIETQRIFESVAKVGGILGLSNQRMELTFLALEQMASKGCHAKGSKIMMFDKSLKNIEDIIVGDLLMGEDYTSREVIGLQNGIDEMFKIIPFKGDSFIVNANHILPVINLEHKREDVRIKNILENYNNYQLISKIEGLLSFTIESEGYGEYWGIELPKNNHIYLDYQSVYQHNTVSMEELRRQLGDNIPGAVQIMARALDVTIPQLYKMIKANEVLAEEALPLFAREMEKTFGAESVKKINTLQSATARFKNEFTLFTQSLQASGLLIFLTKMTTGLMSAFGGGNLQALKYYTGIINEANNAAKSFYDTISKSSKQQISDNERTIQQNNEEMAGLKHKSDRYKALIKENRELGVNTEWLRKNEISPTRDKYLNSLDTEIQRIQRLIVELSVKKKRNADEILFNKTYLETIKQIREETEDSFAKEKKQTGYIDQVQKELDDLIQQRKDLVSETGKRFEYEEKNLELTDKINKKEELLSSLTGKVNKQLEKRESYLERISEKYETMIGKSGTDADKENEEYGDRLKIFNEYWKAVKMNTVKYNTDLQQITLDHINNLGKIEKDNRDKTLTDTKKVFDEIIAIESSDFNTIVSQRKERYNEDLKNAGTDVIERARIEREFQTDMIRMEIQFAALKLTIQQKLGLDTSKEAKELADLMMKLDDAKTDNFIEDIDKEKEALKELQDVQYSLFGDLTPAFSKLNSGFDTINALLEKDIINVEKWGKMRNKLLFQYIITEAAEIYKQFTDIALENIQKEIDGYNKRLSAIKSNLSEEKKEKDEGRSNEYDALITEQAQVEKQRKESLEKYKKLKKQQAFIDLGARISNLSLAASEIFGAHAKQGLPGVIIAIATIAGMLASFAAFKSQIKGAESEQEMGEGGRVDVRNGKKLRGRKHRKDGVRDGIPITAEDKEFVVKAKSAERSDKLLNAVNDGKIDDKLFEAMRWQLPNVTNNNYVDIGMLAYEIGKVEAAQRDTLEYFKNSTQVHELKDGRILLLSNGGLKKEIIHP
jgi:tape measure domain-containing protein